MSAEFTDSVAANMSLIEELILGMPGSARGRCRHAGEALMEVWDKLKKDAPKDPAVALGAAFAVFYLADKLVNPESGGGQKSDGDKLILTLDG